MQVKLNTVTAHLPVRASTGAAGFDLFADSMQWSPDGKTMIIDTGISVAIPEGHVMLIFGRSGQAFKHDIRPANAVGVIDSDYRGPLKVKLTADSIHGKDYLAKVRPGDRIAQFIILQLPQISLVEVETLDETERGAGGFGSTGG